MTMTIYYSNCDIFTYNIVIIVTGRIQERRKSMNIVSILGFFFIRAIDMLNFSLNMLQKLIELT